MRRPLCASSPRGGRSRMRAMVLGTLWESNEVISFSLKTSWPHGTRRRRPLSPRQRITGRRWKSATSYTREDGRPRPDLRLGQSDAGVRKVAAVMMWFEDMAGLGAGAKA